VPNDGTLEQGKDEDETTTTTTQGDAYEREAVVLRARVVASNRGEDFQLPAT